MIKYRRTAIIKRILDFVYRTRKITPLSGSVLSSLRIRLFLLWNRDAIQTVPYLGKPVKFRGSDEQALYEVLVDDEYRFLTKILTLAPSPTIIDVGAHIGTFGIWSLGVNVNVQILSVEADPLTCQIAKNNAKNCTPQGANNWQVIHAAAGANDSDVLFLSDNGPSMSHRIDSSGTIPVQSISLKALLDKMSPGGECVDLVKIDIEGSEEAFLCADPDALQRISSLVVEIHPTLCDTHRVQNLLAECFDRVVSIDGRHSLKPLLYCQRDCILPKH